MGKRRERLRGERVREQKGRGRGGERNEVGWGGRTQAFKCSDARKIGNLQQAATVYILFLKRTVMQVATTKTSINLIKC